MAAIYRPFLRPSVLVRCDAGKSGVREGVVQKMALAPRTALFRSRSYSPCAGVMMETFGRGIGTVGNGERGSSVLTLKSDRMRLAPVSKDLLTIFK